MWRACLRVDRVSVPRACFSSLRAWFFCSVVVSTCVEGICLCVCVERCCFAVRHRMVFVWRCEVDCSDVSCPVYGLSTANNVKWLLIRNTGLRLVSESMCVAWSGMHVADVDNACY